MVKFKKVDLTWWWAKIFIGLIYPVLSCFFAKEKMLLKCILQIK